MLRSLQGLVCRSLKVSPVRAWCHFQYCYFPMAWNDNLKLNLQNNYGQFTVKSEIFFLYLSAKTLVAPLSWACKLPLWAKGRAGPAFPPFPEESGESEPEGCWDPAPSIQVFLREQGLLHLLCMAGMYRGISHQPCTKPVLLVGRVLPKVIES